MARLFCFKCYYFYVHEIAIVIQIRKIMLSTIQKSLWKDFGKNILVSIGIYFLLFLILYIVEWIVPELQAKLLQWHDAAFLVGIPGSLIGTAYVLTIRDPKNYTGFYGGILLNLLLSLQFALQGNWDLVILHSVVFVPFQLTSLLPWPRHTLQSIKMHFV